MGMPEPGPHFFNCPICATAVDLWSAMWLAIECIKKRTVIVRYQCPSCDCIFGPLDMLTHPDIMSTYEEMSVDRVENDPEDRTKEEIEAFNCVNQAGKGGQVPKFWLWQMVQVGSALALRGMGHGRLRALLDCPPPWCPSLWQSRRPQARHL